MPTASDGEGDLPVSRNAPKVAASTDNPANPSRATPPDLRGVPPNTGLSESRYTLIRLIASGGMGAVYEAHDRKLDRRVALKKIRPELIESPEVAERFRREALSAAQLDHPNIVPVYDIGEEAGQQFFTMALIEGESLTAHVRDNGPMNVEDAIRLMLPIIEAVGYAHHRNLIHRDLKPDNVLIDSQGRPRVTDFGLARHLMQPGGLTGTAQVLGTPRYMAPEQVRTSVGAISPATDLYALGGIFVFLLTGQPPISGDSYPEVLLNVLERPPLLPQSCRTDVPAAVNEICRRCLQKQPEDRFQTAQALAGALLTASVPSFRETRPAPTATAEPRQKLTTVLAALAIGLLLTVVALSAFRDKPRDEQANKDGEKGTQPPLPNGTGGTGNPEPKVEPPPVHAEAKMFTLNGHEGRVWVAFTPDNRSLVSWGDDATLRVWDMTTGKESKQLLDAKAEAMSVQMSPDKKMVAVALSSGTARIWALPNWEERIIYTDAAHGVTAVAFSPDGTRLAVGADGGALKVFDVKSGKELAKCVGHSNRIISRGLFFTDGDKKLVSASRDGSIRVWDTATGKQENAVLERESLWAVLPTPNPDHVVVMEGVAAGTEHQVSVFDVKTGKVAGKFGKHTVGDYATSSDGKYLWQVGGFGLTIWDLTQLKEVGADKTVRGSHMAFVPGTDGLLVGAEYTDTTREGETRFMVYKVAGFKVDHLRALQEHRKDITSLSVSPDGKFVATGDESGVIKVWDARVLTRPK